jgi:hypothetical protein
MPELRDWWDDLWGKVKHSPAILPTHRAIPSSHVDKKEGEPFRRDQHYFVVRVNQIFLKYDRQFWTTYAPMALFVSEFDYDEDDKVVPFVVGPGMLEKNKIELPSGFIFSDTKVAGIHPYKGGGLKLTVILYRVKRTDLAKSMLKVIEKFASVVDLSQTLATYIKIANALVETVAEVVGSDGDNQPIIGLRKEFDAVEGFAPGYFALIDSGNAKIDVNKLWVKENELLFGDSLEMAAPFTDANYVLYSIKQTTSRDDFTRLGFYKQWKVALAESLTKDQEKWTSAKANWIALCQMMELSPDLVKPQADALADECFSLMERNHKKIVAQNAKMGAGVGESAEEVAEDTELQGISERLNRVRSKSVAILE